MEWKVVDETLIIEGDFFALSSGLLGGWRQVEHLFNHTVKDHELKDPVSYLKSVAERFGMKNYFGLLTAVPMDKLAIVEVEDVTAFVTAGVRNPNERIGTINVIVIVEGDMPDGAMVNAVITATEAKSMALLKSGLNFTGTCTDAVIIAKTGYGRFYEYAGYASELGRKIWTAVKNAVKDSLSKWGDEFNPP
jgi:adenosylcobinamide hydrolase